MAPVASAQQLELPGLTAPEPPKEPRVFVRGAAIDRTSIARYLHIVRGPDDPQRSPRPVGGLDDRAPHLTLATATLQDCRAQILALLADGHARTFNAIAVELLDHTADTVLDSPYDRALWHLVETDELEHTLDLPILFRLAQDGR